MTMLSNRGVAHLISALHGPLLARMANLPPVLELGTIQDDGSLRLRGLAQLIPQGTYFVARDLALPDPLTTTSAAGGPTDPAHTHTVPRADGLNALTQGDTVLCGWTRDGADIVVLCVVVRS